MSEPMRRAAALFRRVGKAPGPFLWLLSAVVGALLPGLPVAAAPGADDVVLLASTAPGYAPGMVVTATDPLHLPEGASMTLLFRSGQMLQMRGPFDGTLSSMHSPADTDSVTTLAGVFRMQGVDATVIGGARAIHIVGLREAGTDIQVNPQHSGTWCVHDADLIWIARPDSDGQFALRRRGSVRAIAWPAGATRIEWPADLLLEDGDRFEVIHDGTATTSLTFRMPGKAASDAAALAEGILLGCREQFTDALHQLARAALPPELWLGSDHGRNPVYHSGESIALTLQPGAEGYLYCVRMREGGKAWPLFPAGAVDGARVREAEKLEIPGQRLGTALLAGPPGIDRIRCWLADRDIAPELPQALLEAPATPLPDQLAARLDAIFAGIGGSRIATAELRVRTE
jgi:hypothetical protein